MKKTIILLGLIAILSSCNTGRIADLEAENMELKATIERLTIEAKEALVRAQDATVAARIAEREAMKAQEAAQKAERQ